MTTVNVDCHRRFLSERNRPLLACTQLARDTSASATTRRQRPISEIKMCLGTSRLSEPMWIRAGCTFSCRHQLWIKNRSHDVDLIWSHWTFLPSLTTVGVHDEGISGGCDDMNCMQFSLCSWVMAVAMISVYHSWDAYNS
jgi:hypothetical protein